MCRFEWTGYSNTGGELLWHGAEIVQIARYYEHETWEDFPHSRMMKTDRFIDNANQL
jgi:hypothetical protein